MAEGQQEILTWKDDNDGVHVVPIDLVTSHSDDRTAEVTSHPVEKGANINDHIIQQPDTLSLELAQTQSPFPSAAFPGAYYSKPKGFSIKNIVLDVPENRFQPGGLLALSRGAGALIGSALEAVGLKKPPPPFSVNVFAADGPVDRIGELHDQLIDIKQNGRLCTVTFRGRVCPDYVVTRVSWKSSKGEAGLGRFTLELQKLNIVSTDVADLPDPASLRLKPVKTQAKPPKPVEDPKPRASGSVGESLLSKGTGLGAV